MKQIETPRLPDPIMRRPCADREEKRVTHANETARDPRERDDKQPGGPDRNSLTATTPIREALSRPCEETLDRRLPDEKLLYALRHRIIPWKKNF